MLATALFSHHTMMAKAMGVRLPPFVYVGLEKSFRAMVLRIAIKRALFDIQSC